MQIFNSCILFQGHQTPNIAPSFGSLDRNCRAKTNSKKKKINISFTRRLAWLKGIICNEIKWPNLQSQIWSWKHSLEWQPLSTRKPAEPSQDRRDTQKIPKLWIQTELGGVIGIASGIVMVPSRKAVPGGLVDIKDLQQSSKSTLDMHKNCTQLKL